MPAPSSGPGGGSSASEYRVGEALAGLPVAGSSWRSLIPLQNDPKTSHLLPGAPLTRDGSMALKSSAVVERKMRPSSVQWYWGRRGSSVGVVASPITEFFEPKLDPA